VSARHRRQEACPAVAMMQRRQRHAEPIATSEQEEGHIQEVVSSKEGRQVEGGGRGGKCSVGVEG